MGSYCDRLERERDAARSSASASAAAMSAQRDFTMQKINEAREQANAAVAERDKAREDVKKITALYEEMRTDRDMAIEERERLLLLIENLRDRDESTNRGYLTKAERDIAALHMQVENMRRMRYDANCTIDALKAARDSEIARRREVAERYSALVDAYANRASEIIDLKEQLANVKKERDSDAQSLGVQKRIAEKALAERDEANRRFNNMSMGANTEVGAVFVSWKDYEDLLKERDALKTKLAKLAEIHEQRIAMREMRFESSREDRILDKRMNEMFKELKSN